MTKRDKTISNESVGWGNAVAYARVKHSVTPARVPTGFKKKKKTSVGGSHMRKTGRGNKPSKS